MLKQKATPKLSDYDANSINIFTEWKSKSSKTNEMACQTDSELYQFADMDIQTGLHAEIYQELVSEKYDGATLLDFLIHKFPNKSEIQVMNFTS